MSEFLVSIDKDTERKMLDVILEKHNLVLHEEKIYGTHTAYQSFLKYVSSPKESDKSKWYFLLILTYDFLTKFFLSR